MATQTHMERDPEKPTWAEAAEKVSFEENPDVTLAEPLSEAAIREEARLVRK